MEVAQDYKSDVIFEPDAILALQTAAEDYTIDLFHVRTQVLDHFSHYLIPYLIFWCPNQWSWHVWHVPWMSLFQQAAMNQGIHARREVLLPRVLPLDSRKSSAFGCSVANWRNFTGYSYGPAGPRYDPLSGIIDWFPGFGLILYDLLNCGNMPLEFPWRSSFQKKHSCGCQLLWKRIKQICLFRFRRYKHDIL